MPRTATPAFVLFAPRPARRAGLVARLVAWAALRRSRASLAALDDHLLRDVGLSREQARQEAARPSWDTAWDAPAHWLR